ncbi:hypothetical protein AGMMS50276_05060 [Synergistales bacterium]|nr:hypothetical protein AGMMS50276_05060 [Synergistales bacterium]
MKRTITAVLYPQSDGGYTVVCPELQGCVTEGDTFAEALHNIREAAELMIDGDDDAMSQLEASNFSGRIIADVEIEA